MAFWSQIMPNMRQNFSTLYLNLNLLLHNSFIQKISKISHTDPKIWPKDPKIDISVKCRSQTRIFGNMSHMPVWSPQLVLTSCWKLKKSNVALSTNSEKCWFLDHFCKKCWLSKFFPKIWLHHILAFVVIRLYAKFQKKQMSESRDISQHPKFGVLVPYHAQCESKFSNLYLNIKLLLH